jgi:BirA family biotin operon repressor/biotin-[acetyl-CoA-carboxylase] ligase
MVIRDPPRLLSLSAGVAVAEVAADVAHGDGRESRLKWPNDVLIDGRKVAGILVEGRPQARWAVLGIGLNVAFAEADFPPELRDRAATLGLEPAAVEPTLERLLASLERWIAAPAGAILAAVRERDALRGGQVRWSDGDGLADGIDHEGRLLIATADGRRLALEAGEVHLVAGVDGPTNLSQTVTMSEAQLAEYVEEHAPELDPKQVAAFMAEHPKPDDESSHIGWAVRTLREVGEGEAGDGLSVDRVADELRRRAR